MHDILLKLSDPVGMLGVVVILVAYYLLSVGRWPANTLRFQLLNFLGAWLILFSLYFHWNLSSVVIEVAWVIISLVGIYHALERNKKKINS